MKDIHQITNKIEEAFIKDLDEESNPESLITCIRKFQLQLLRHLKYEDDCEISKDELFSIVQSSYVPFGFGKGYFEAILLLFSLFELSEDEMGQIISLVFKRIRFNFSRGRFMILEKNVFKIKESGELDLFLLIYLLNLRWQNVELDRFLSHYSKTFQLGRQKEIEYFKGKSEAFFMEWLIEKAPEYLVGCGLFLVSEKKLENEQKKYVYGYVYNNVLRCIFPKTIEYLELFLARDIIKDAMIRIFENLFDFKNKNIIDNEIDNTRGLLSEKLFEKLWDIYNFESGKQLLIERSLELDPIDNYQLELDYDSLKYSSDTITDIMGTRTFRKSSHCDIFEIKNKWLHNSTSDFRTFNVLYNIINGAGTTIVAVVISQLSSRVYYEYAINKYSKLLIEIFETPCSLEEGLEKLSRRLNISINSESRELSSLKMQYDKVIKKLIDRSILIPVDFPIYGCSDKREAVIGSS